MTAVANDPDQIGPLGDALDEVRRSAQLLLADLGDRPRALRIRAGDVLVEMEWVDGQTAPAPVAAPAPVGEVSTGVDICAPTVGTFYRAPEPGAPPFVSEGDQVRRGQQVGIVEAMKLMIPVEAEGDGRVVAVHVADGTPVEYGDRLVTIEPTEG